MKPENEFFAGESKFLEYIICDEETRQPEDITLFTVLLKVSLLGDTKNVLFEKQGMIDASVTGKVIFDLLPSDTQGFSENYYNYQIIISQGTTNRSIIDGLWLIKGGMI